ncbi:FixH family protein [Cohnella nanjingensis]|uniref:FixH family protein n=1 Tax=Cohnella nanjingensis TaxID=1387779 RepID=A0A7X0VHJ0_9BACL|nr:FixH family protein [Cohnella nanjingensis]MBB6672699.1 FixH family protein [Cohnella nanjingensis]
MTKTVKTTVAGLLILAAIALGALYISQGSAEASPVTRFERDGIRVEIRSPDRPIAALRESRFTITLQDANGQPIRRADLKMVMFMPKMYCGDFVAKIDEVAPGVYDAVGVLPMRGNWKAELKMKIGAQAATVAHYFKTV